MEGIITFVVQNPNAFIVTLSLAVALFFGNELFKSFKKRVDSFETDLDVKSKSLENALKETRHVISMHREDMGKAVKAIQGDLLKTQEKLFALKQELLSEVENIKRLSSATAHSLTLANETSKLAIDQLNEKLGRVILIEKDLSLHKVQIEKLYTQSGEQASTQSKYQDYFGKIGQVLKLHREKLEAIEKETKGKKNEI